MLREIPLFSRLDDKALGDLEKAAIKRAYPKNTILISKGDKSDQLFVVLKGKLKVAVTDASGKEIIMSLLGAGDYFGEMAMIDGESRSATIVTTQASDVLTISRDDFHRTLLSSPELMFELLKVLARKVRIATDKLESLAFEDVYGRLVKLLIQLAKPRDDRWMVEESLTHQEIANMIGSSREMVTRILKALTSGGYISVDKKRITIKRKFPASF
ncbi:MAG: Crp/Fnr family transcriptional regulator [Desulfobacterota bacterium]|jgi:CRP/FNR family cyclic AMP-dependent transcriptional regulator|nr:Crp/Fnr family transcriptional regulator [Thermodesulfobacteriota bacterium]